MAVVLDINILCKKMLDINLIENLIENYGVTINSISTIDNWGWANEQQLKSLIQITKVTEDNKIAIINLGAPSIKDLGIYIERIKDAYLYTLWLDTEGYPKLDCDMVTSENRKYYEEVYQRILKIGSKNLNLIDIVGVGVETDFCYSKNSLDIIQKSQNIVLWILNDEINAKEVLMGYREKPISDLGKTLFEKIE